VIGSMDNSLNGHVRSVMALETLPSGDIVSGSVDKTIKIWKSTNFTLNKTFSGQKNTVQLLKILLNGNIVSADLRRNIY
jgi:WD40 repeat protein